MFDAKAFVTKLAFDIMLHGFALPDAEGCENFMQSDNDCRDTKLWHMLIPC